jgi:hypothetical protein
VRAFLASALTAAAMALGFFVPTLAQPSCGGLFPPCGSGVDFDLSGKWVPRHHEEQFERAPGREVGDYLGLPINDAARRRADAYDATWLSLPEWQCRPMQGDSVWRGPSVARIWHEYDPNSWGLTAIRIFIRHERPIWMDGRARPPEEAPHDWNGFSTGEWNGDVLTVTATHLKEGYVERNGLPRSDLATYRQHFIRYDNWMTVVTIVYDPVYLTEPLILTSEYELENDRIMAPYLCTVIEEVERPKGVVPHWLPGTNHASEEFAKQHRLPVEAARGGAETMYPEYRLTLKSLTNRSQ